MKDELLPCPFCGSPGEIWETQTRDGYEPDDQTVGCSYPLCTMHPHRKERTAKWEKGRGIFRVDKREFLTKAWNSRPPVSGQAQAGPEYCEHGVTSCPSCGTDGSEPKAERESGPTSALFCTNPGHRAIFGTSTPGVCPTCGYQIRDSILGPQQEPPATSQAQQPKSPVGAATVTPRGALDEVDGTLAAVLAAMNDEEWADARAAVWTARNIISRYRFKRGAVPPTSSVKPREWWASGGIMYDSRKTAETFAIIWKDDPSGIVHVHEVLPTSAAVTVSREATLWLERFADKGHLQAHEIIAALAAAAGTGEPAE